MQLYVNVLIEQSRLCRPRQILVVVTSANSQWRLHILEIEMIRLYRGALTLLLPSSRQCQDVLKLLGIKIFPCDDCKITLRLTGYLRVAICSSVAVSLFCNELSPFTIK